MYEVFEHTADLGLHLEANDLNGLFAEAGRGLCSLIIENIEDIVPTTTISINISGTTSDQDSTEYLLFDWLNELLYQFESQRLLLTNFEIAFTEQGLKAKAQGEKFDPARHQTDHEVKAITYHGLKVVQTANGWIAEVIVDI